MAELLQAHQIEVLIGLLMLLGYMVSYIYAPPQPFRIPPELLVGSIPAEDPFRHPDVMHRIIDGLCRFNRRIF